MELFGSQGTLKRLDYSVSKSLWVQTRSPIYGCCGVRQQADDVAIDTLLVVNQDITENEWGDEMKGSA